MTARKTRFTLKAIVSTVALLFLLVILPLGSWYYLQTGLEYRKAAMSELQDYGKVPPLQLVRHDGDTLHQEAMLGKIVLAAFLDLQAAGQTARTGELLAKLHDQFDERQDVAFLIHLLDATATKQGIDDFAANYTLQDSLQCYFLTGDAEAMRTLAREVYKIDDEKLDNYFALADTKGMVRRQYDTRQPADMTRLVEHIALLMPKQKDRPAAGRRRTEGQE
ncbi:MAG TPA: hypothetical protein PKC76_01535 [Saprospiraceae bacterium]|mgnify:FL=1|nr:hypothetical protein [Saprospiraceae bacterium]HMP22777.1 hypothetical protein [Saprospiraceae bacterium]